MRPFAWLQVLEKKGSLAIPHNFQPTAPAYNPASQGPKAKGKMPTQFIRNPQVCVCVFEGSVIESIGFAADFYIRAGQLRQGK